MQIQSGGKTQELNHLVLSPNCYFMAEVKVSEREYEKEDREEKK